MTTVQNDDLIYLNTPPLLPDGTPQSPMIQLNFSGTFNNNKVSDLEWSTSNGDYVLGPGGQYITPSTSGTYTATMTITGNSTLDDGTSLYVGNYTANYKYTVPAGEGATGEGAAGEAATGGVDFTLEELASIDPLVLGVMEMTATSFDNPDALDLPTVTCAMPASKFNDIFKLELTDPSGSNIKNVAPIKTNEHFYINEKITHHVDSSALPELVSSAGVSLSQLSVVNKHAVDDVKYIQQRTDATDTASVVDSILAEFSYQATALHNYDDDLTNRDTLSNQLSLYLNTALKSNIVAKLDTNNSAGDHKSHTTRANISREIFLQMFNADDANGTTRTQDMFADDKKDDHNLYPLEFIAGDSLRFKVTFQGKKSSLVDKVEGDIEDRAVEVILQLK